MFGHVMLWIFASMGMILALGIVGAVICALSPRLENSPPALPTKATPEPPKPELLHRVVITRRDALNR